VFGGRGAFIHAGAVIATIMTANVAMLIIPNQRIVVADLIAGRRLTRRWAWPPSSARCTTTTSPCRCCS
jgi:uncharacterized membrane protein